MTAHLIYRDLLEKWERQHPNPEFPDCFACGPCYCDDECGCIPGPCAKCGHGVAEVAE